MSPSSLPPPAPTRRILVVDDDDGRRGLLSEVLAHEGYRVETLPDGEGVLDAVRQAPPDLILLDVMLPGVSGFELCGDLRMHDESRLIPIILMTAVCPDEDSAVRGLLSGADDYITKPTRLAEIRARVRVQMRNRRDRELLEWARAERATLRKEAVLDPLTGVLNRRGGDEAVTAALNAGQSTMVLLIDVDHFKKINDEHGHAVGDTVLSSVASALERSSRKLDSVARFGGDEFLVVVQGATPEHAESIGLRYLQAVRAMILDEAPKDVSVSVSIGAAVWDGHGAVPSPSELLASADNALYRSKRMGRDTVQFDHLISGCSVSGFRDRERPSS